MRYDFISVDTFLNAWAYEANCFFLDLLVGAQSQDQFDSVLRNAMNQFFNADIGMGKLYCTSIITLGDDGVPSGNFRRISMAANPSLFSCCNVMRLDGRSETSMHFVASVGATYGKF